MNDPDDLERWIARQYPIALANMLRSVSATGIVKRRDGYGQIIVPAKGSVVASPELASYNPDPDYFFHWYRDSAIVMDALRLVGTQEAAQHFCDFVDFSLALDRLDPRELVRNAAWRQVIAPELRQFVRNDDDLADAEVRGESRVNPDGSLDILGWGRPQYDGVATRALTLMRWCRSHRTFGVREDQAIKTLLREDLLFVLAHWRIPTVDIWEEEKADHYYSLRLQAAALEFGAAWLDEQGELQLAQSARDDATEILQRLDGYWLPEAGYFRSRLRKDGSASDKDLDIAVILAAIHAGGTSSHSPADERMVATLDRLDALFETEYPINRERPADRGPALGRYRGDVYYSGGAYYFSTLAAAEFCFQRACALKSTDPSQAAAFVARGDAYLRTIRAFTPENGEMSEQFDKTTGEHTSAKHLAWSYAGFISAVAAKQKAGGV